MAISSTGPGFDRRRDRSFCLRLDQNNGSLAIRPPAHDSQTRPPHAFCFPREPFLRQNPHRKCTFGNQPFRELLMRIRDTKSECSTCSCWATWCRPLAHRPPSGAGDACSFSVPHFCEFGSGSSPFFLFCSHQAQVIFDAHEGPRLGLGLGLGLGSGLGSDSGWDFRVSRPRPFNSALLLLMRAT